MLTAILEYIGGIEFQYKYLHMMKPFKKMTRVFRLIFCDNNATRKYQRKVLG